MKHFRVKTLRVCVPLVLAAVCSTAFSATEVKPNAKAAIVASDPTPISCNGTPFGHYLTLGQDAEMITEAATSGSFNAFDEYTFAATPSPVISRSFRSTLLQTGLAGAQFQKGVTADLNGDGKDEVITANRLSNGNLMLAVYHRTSGPASTLFDTWTLTGAFGSVDLAVGDFEGTNDGKQELAVMVRSTAGVVNVYLLTGSSDGGISQGDNAYVGKWTMSGTATSNVTMTHGDMLLDHREQMVVVSESGSGSSRVLNYSLLEYQPVTTLLVIGSNTNIGSKSFAINIGNVFTTDNMSSYSFQNIYKMQAIAGDLVDTPAAELVLHVQAGDSENGYFIGQRLQHFAATRNTNNMITAIALSTDFSQLVQSQTDSAMTWDAAIANVDVVSPNQIVFAHADPGNFAEKVDVYKAYAVARSPVTNPPMYDYKLNTAPSFSGSYDTGGSGQDLALMNVAVGDMDKDGLAEIMTIVRDAQVVRRSHWVLDITPETPTTLIGTHSEEPLGSNNYTALGIQAADFDGDSVHASVSDDSQQVLCEEVSEPMLRDVVWLPPYFSKIIDPTKQPLSSFGKSINSTTSSGSSFSTYTSSDISISVGVSVGGEVLGIGAEAEAKATAGYNYQAETGQSQSTDMSTEVDQGFQTVGGDALVGYEQNSFDCYSYDIVRNTTGVATDSSMRMCNLLSAQKQISSTDAESWETSVPLENSTPPAQWVPLQRDWASLSLFRPVTSNATFISGHEAAQATDGIFTILNSPDSDADTSTDDFTNGADSGTTPINEPYLQVDLGQLYDVSDIRVFPIKGHAADLKNFRIYASPEPMNGAAVPSGSSVKVYSNPINAGFSYDRWNVWTNDPNNPLRARYVRLQLPGASGTIHVSELQVFGDVHNEPQRYPQAVCQTDAQRTHHFFQAAVWNPMTSSFQTIQTRGDLLWDGTSGANALKSTPSDPSWCTDSTAFNSTAIWQSVFIGDTGTPTWDLNSSTSTTFQKTTSSDSSTRVGAELDLKGGFVAQATASGAYSYTTGTTTESSSGMTWGGGLQISGQAVGFVTQPGGVADQTLIKKCEYSAQPYAYQLSERSDTGYEHNIYVVDYVVLDVIGTTTNGWTRANISDTCYTKPDPIFIGSFD